uniref:Anaphylatoxin-like domain-containing protein n=1 Tax=Suricata suricatta TaxID=37032 RepID=A0A673U5J0_SURSU
MLSCIISASKYNHPFLRKCCYDGASQKEESCEERAARITFGPRCSRVFTHCCELANQRRSTSYIPVMIGRRGVCQHSCFVCGTVRRCQAESALPLEEVLPHLV